MRPGGIGFRQVPLGETVVAEDHVVFRRHGFAHQPGNSVQERRPRMERRHDADRNRCQCLHALDGRRSRGCGVLRVHGNEENLTDISQGGDAVSQARFPVAHANGDPQATQAAHALRQRLRMVNEGRPGRVVAPDGAVCLGAPPQAGRKNKPGHDQAPYRPGHVHDVGVHQELVQVAAHRGGIAAGGRSEIGDQNAALVDAVRVPHGFSHCSKAVTDGQPCRDFGHRLPSRGYD